MTGPEITRVSAELSSGHARVWVGRHFVVAVLDGAPLVVPPHTWDGPTMAAFAQALDEAAAHCPAPPDERKP